MELPHIAGGASSGCDRRSRPRRTSVAALIAGLSTALALAGCGGVSSGGGGGSGANAQTTTQDLAKYIGKPSPKLCGGKQYVFGYDEFSDTDAFQVAMWKGMQSVANQLGCVKINKLSDNTDPATAVQNARIFAQQKVDGAILFNVVQAASQGQAQVLQAAHIPVVSLAVPAQGGVFVTNDDHSDGVKAGKALGQAYLADRQHGPAYAVIGRYDAQDSTKQRMDGVIEGLKETVPSAKILPLETKADPPTAQSGTTALMPKIPSNATILVSGVNDDVTYALYQGVKQAGRQDHALVVSIGGANPAGMTFLCQNQQYAGSVAFFPENWGKYLIPALIAEIRGAKVPSKVTVPTAVVTRQNIAQYYPDFKCQ